MAPNDMEDFAAGFEDERAAPPGDESMGGEQPAAAATEAEPVTEGAATEGAATGGMDVEASAAAEGVDVAAVEGAAEAGAAVDGPAAGDKIERMPEGGQSAAADNAAGSEAAPADAVVVIGAAAGDENPAGEEALEEPTDPKDIQRKKSWEGRLKAEESRLKELAATLEAKGAAKGEEPGQASAEALESVSETAVDPELANAAGDLSAQVESGEITADEAMKQLSEDFGEPFIKMIQTIAGAAAGEAVKGRDSEIEGLRGELKSANEKADALIEHLSNERLRTHFEQLKAAKPNFAEVNADPAFDAFIANLPPDQKATAEATRSGGSVQDIVALLDQFESTQGASKEEPAAEPAPAVAAAKPTPTATASEDEIDAAAGVRGGGMSLPSEPAGEDDFAAAWDDAPDVSSNKRG